MFLAAAAAIAAVPALAQTQPQTGPFPLNSVTRSGPLGAAGQRPASVEYPWQMRAMIQSTPTENTGADLNNGRPFAPAGRLSAPLN